MKAPRKRNHVPKDQWVPCAGCGRRVEWGGQLPNGMCAACNEPDIAALCREIDKRDAKWTEGDALVAMRRYRAWAQAAASLSPDGVSLMTERPSADSGKRGGGPNNGRGE